MSRVVKKSNISVVIRKYIDQQGKEKSIWKTIGELTTFQKDDGTYNTIAELYFMPGATIGVFEQKEKEPVQQAPQQYQQAPQTQPTQELNLQSIPF